MMMTQWGLAQGEHGARARMIYRAAAAVIALGIAVLCFGRPAKAEVHPVHMRRVAAARQTNSVQTAHARPRSGASNANAGRGAAKNTSSSNTSSKTSFKGAAERGNRARSGSAQRNANASRTGARAKTRRHKQPSQADDHNSPVFHRASVVRRRGESEGRREIAAHASRDKPRPSKSVAEVAAESATESAAESKDAQGVSNRQVVAEVKPLTVDDFLHAANAPAVPATGIYASGEAHPDEDVSSAQLSRAAPVDRVGPSDLVGAPYAAPERATRTADAGDEPHVAGLRGPSRQELVEEVEQPVVLPGLYRNGRLAVPPPLKGTREILVHQNIMADDEGLQRVQDDYDLRRMRAMRQLVDFPESASLHVNPELADNRRCARPWTVHFASDIARSFYARFHEPLQVNSAVRTVAYQVRLRRVNGNAAGVDGDVASPHLTGEALDFGKRGMSVEEIAWMRTYLLPLMQGGKLDVEEEFQQACFHISVYRTYLPSLPATKRRPVGRSEVAQLREPRVPKVVSRADLDQ
jgi:hypothetical protein